MWTTKPHECHESIFVYKMYFLMYIYLYIEKSGDLCAGLFNFIFQHSYPFTLLF